MSLTNKIIAFIGGGNMAEALIRGLLDKRVVSPDQVIATDVRPERREFLEASYRVRTTADNVAAARDASIVVLAVKPQQIGTVLTGMKPGIHGETLIISIAAGITTARIEQSLGGQPHVIRVMPNTPALVGVGAAALARGAWANDTDLQTADTILKAVGISVVVEEGLVDAVTALSGSGPAYVFLIAEAMIQAGIEQGLAPQVARQLAIQTVLGAGTLLAASNDTPDDLRRKVTSPGGTTEAALQVMADRKLIGIFSEAIAAAARRGRELAKA